MEYSYLAVILAMKFLQSIFNKRTSDKLSGITQYLNYGAFRYILSGLLALLILLVTGGITGGVTLLEIGISLITAVSLVISMFCSLKAMKSGAIVLVTLAGSAGLLIPCICGIFMFGEKMSAFQFVGIGVLMLSAYLLAGYSKKLNGKFSFETILLLIGAMLSNGMVMLAQKMYSLYVTNGNAAVFSFLSFGIAGIVLLVCYGAGLLIKHEKPVLLSKPLVGYGVILSVSLLVINQLATIAASVIPSAVLFSVNDGGGTIIAALAAAVFFKEKLTPRSILGIAAGIAALLIINIF